MTPTSAQILLCTAESAGAGDVGRLLQEAGHPVHRHGLVLNGVLDLARYGLVVVDGCHASAEALTWCRHLRSRLAQSFAPILIILDDPAPGARLDSLDAGADAYLVRPFLASELLAQVESGLRLRRLHARLADQTAELQRANQRLKLAYQQIDLELEAARRLQRSFLPQTLPEVGRARCAVYYRPCGRVGGDFYDVFRLDEDHIGFTIADAMGHGVSASLLTLFLKRGIQPKEITGRQYRLVPPGAVLQRLNRDLLDQALPEAPFITMLYGVLDCRDGTVQFARAGHPLPLRVPRAGGIEPWPASGGLLGVLVADFPPQTQRLEPGDKLVLYTDGLDTSIPEGTPTAGERLHAGALELRHLPIQDFVPQLGHKLISQVRQADDFTLLGVEMT